MNGSSQIEEEIRAPPAKGESSSPVTTRPPGPCLAGEPLLSKPVLAPSLSPPGPREEPESKSAGPPEHRTGAENPDE